MISDEQIKKFKKLYKQKLGKEISQEEIYEKGTKLIRLMRLIYKPISKEEFKNIKKKSS